MRSCTVGVVLREKDDTVNVCLNASSYGRHVIRILPLLAPLLTPGTEGMRSLIFANNSGDKLRAKPPNAALLMNSLRFMLSPFEIACKVKDSF